MTRTLEIRLEDQRVGWLVQATGRIGVRFDSDWREHPHRRVLSLSVENTGLADIRATPHLPTWFENLLFEGELRRWIQESEPIASDQLTLLERLGRDLPGAVTLQPSPEGVPVDAGAPLAPRPAPAGGLRWSLAGVQLKLNLNAKGERFTLPVHGELGHFIAKFADRSYAGVPRNEHATMSWARAAGINAAETRLVAATSIDDIPPALRASDEPVLLVARFDRESGRRIHAEEFAQILGLRPAEKYSRFGWRHQLDVIASACPQDIGEYLRRLLFMVLSGNTDAHHKNIGVRYPDGRRPRLSPAYDQVATVAWTASAGLGGSAGLEDSLAFKMGNSRRWEDVRLGSIEALVAKANIAAFEDRGFVIRGDDLREWLRLSAVQIRDALPTVESVGGLAYLDLVTQHWRRVPLMFEL